jgi:branched-chain amino acid transport system ATP-binding protein
MVALIGPNGAGKTTCFNLINGQLTPDAGEVRLAGERIDGLPARRIAARRVGRTFQTAAVFASMTVRENVQLALIAAAGEQWSVASTRAHWLADALLERVGADPLAARGATLAYGDLAGGQLHSPLRHDCC